jgi:hypothetical protein
MKSVLKILSVILFLFAGVTLFMSGSIIFDAFGIREQEGNYVLFVVVANFICGFLYALAAYGLFGRKTWTTPLLFLATGILLVAFISLLWHIDGGGNYEERTIKAMIFRIVVTSVFAILSYGLITKNQKLAKPTTSN